MKRRIRFGIKLSWPITNAAVFVIYMPQVQFLNLLKAVDQVRLFLPSDINARLVCEDSTPINK